MERTTDLRQVAAIDWRRTLWLMVLIQALMSAALAVLTPFLPLYLVELGITDPARLNLWSGAINSINFLVAAVASPLWGALADRVGRRAMVLRSSLAICVFTALMGLSTEPWQLFALRALMGAFSGFSATAIALVATQAPEARLGYALGWLSTGQLVGALLGPVLGGLLADFLHQYRFVFYWTSLLAALVVVLVWAMVREPAAPSGEASAGARSAPPVRLRLVLPLFLVLLLVQFATRAVQPVVTLFVRDLVGAAGNLATLAGVAFSITGLADLIASPFLGRRSDVIGYRRVLLISLCGAALCTLPQAFVHSYWQFLLARFGTGLFVGGLLPTTNALIGRLVPAARRGRAYGITASATFLGSFLGPFSGGAVAAAFGIRHVFVLTAALLLVNAFWVLLRIREPPREGAPGE